MLHKVGRFNDIPKEQLPKIPAKGSITTYQFTALTYDSATKKSYYADTLVLPSLSRFWDEENGKWVEIGMIGAVDQNGAPVPATIRHIVTHPHRTGGYLSITHGEAEADDLYQYLELASFVGTNAKRDASVEVILNKKDFQKDAEAEMEKMELEHEAFGAAYALKGDDLTDMANILGIDTSIQPVQVRQQVASFAKKNPETFIALKGDPDKATKAILAAGLANGTLVINEASSAVTDANGAVLVQLSDTNREEVLKQWAAHVNGLEKTKGANFLKGIKALVDLTDKKAGK